ncbi:MAG: phenylalanine--tRNA ligase subunit alpha, partial [Candidatus Taylorbacteria bacterium]|nr:phenylalanine--tRNA ligase subunit alpha [Candidatus Taylorbacteria bacterium]
HFMEENKPPLRIICPGKVFRNEATDARHEAQFNQFEGLYVDKDVSLATLKTILNKFFDKFFEKNVDIRFRPSYFPFVEPGVEIDVSCFKCNRDADIADKTRINADDKKVDKKCSVCGGGGWLEVMGAGVVHPKVLNGVGINPNEWKGFAFGGGVDRLAMLKYGIDDIRLFYSGDLRLVNQF